MKKHQFIYNHRLINKAERITFKNIDSFEIMKRAAKACYLFILKKFSPKKILILCGMGNNGGDGVLIAQYLLKHNFSIDVNYPFGFPKTKDSKKALNLLIDTKVIKDNISFDDYDLIIDALFGTGLNKKLKKTTISLFKEINKAKAKAKVVSIDMPSGVFTDNGQIDGLAINANLTLTLHRYKPGQWLLPGKEYCGEIIVLDIGLSNIDQECSLKLNYPDFFPTPSLNDHKFSRGCCFVVAGYQLIGAAKLACLSASKSALRAGTGVCKIILHESQIDYFKPHILEEMLVTYKDNNDFISIIKGEKCNSIIYGCGIENSLPNKEILKFLLQQPISLVLDGTAFTIIQENIDEFMQFLKSRSEETVMTPHRGEFGRIFNITNNKINDCILAAKKSNSIVVYKGSDTVISSPNDEVYINSNSSAHLATAGSGDVLAGLIGGFMSQGLNAIRAAQLGCYVHSQCGINLGKGLIASDLIMEIPNVLKKIY